MSGQSAKTPDPRWDDILTHLCPFPASSRDVCYSRLGQGQSSSHLKLSSQVLACHSVEWEHFHYSVSINSLSSCFSQYIIVQVWVWFSLRVWHLHVFLTKIILSHQNADSTLKEAISDITWSCVEYNLWVKWWPAVRQPLSCVKGSQSALQFLQLLEFYYKET